MAAGTITHTVVVIVIMIVATGFMSLICRQVDIITATTTAGDRAAMVLTMATAPSLTEVAKTTRRALISPARKTLRATRNLPMGRARQVGRNLLLGRARQVGRNLLLGRARRQVGRKVPEAWARVSPHRCHKKNRVTQTLKSTASDNSDSIRAVDA